MRLIRDGGGPMFDFICLDGAIRLSAMHVRFLFAIAC